MANYLDKINLPTAVSDHTKLDLGHQHITTTDFMELGVDYIRELVPGEKISVNMETFARLNAMPVPTFSRSNLKHSAFFVPMRTIMRSFNDMMVDTVHVGSDGDISNNGIVSQVPTITMKQLQTIFLGSVATGDTASASTSAMLYVVPFSPGQEMISDIFVAGDGDSTYYNFTNIGRQVYKTLLSLGYQVSFDPAYNDTFSILPILALIKVYADYYFPNQYENLTVYQNMLLMTNFDRGTDAFDVDITILRNILVLCSYVQFESDYFISAWDNPVAPSNGNFSTLKFEDITMRAGTGSTTDNYSMATNVSRFNGTPADYNIYSTPFLQGRSRITTSSSNATPFNLTDYALTALKSLTDYMQRHKLVSSRTYERFLARYGQALPAEKLNRSVYLGTQIQPIQIGDVFSSSDTEGAKLGDYAGKGQSYGHAQWTYNTDEFGYFIVLTSVVPSTGYFQGVDKQNYRITKTQFYVPEFDQLGVEPIQGSELYVPQNNLFSGLTGAPSQVFGFSPRYASYKISRDNLTGNFRFNSLNSANPVWPEVINGANSWHTMRIFDGLTSFSGSSANIVHSPDFIYGYKNAGQFKRLFYDIDPVSPDNMTLIHNFEIASWFPGKALYDTYEFSNEDDNPKRVTLQNNGVKVN